MAAVGGWGASGVVISGKPDDAAGCPQVSAGIFDRQSQRTLEDGLKGVRTRCTHEYTISTAHSLLRCPDHCDEETGEMRESRRLLAGVDGPECLAERGCEGERSRLKPIKAGKSGATRQRRHRAANRCRLAPHGST